MRKREILREIPHIIERGMTENGENEKERWRNEKKRKKEGAVVKE